MSIAFSVNTKRPLTSLHCHANSYKKPNLPHSIKTSTGTLKSWMQQETRITSSLLPVAHHMGLNMHPLRFLKRKVSQHLCTWFPWKLFLNINRIVNTLLFSFNTKSVAEYADFQFPVSMHFLCFVGLMSVFSCQFLSCCEHN